MSADPSLCFGKYGTVNDKHWCLRTGAGVLELRMINDPGRRACVPFVDITRYNVACASYITLSRPAAPRTQLPALRLCEQTC